MQHKRTYTVTVEKRPDSPCWQARMYFEGDKGTSQRWSTRIPIGDEPKASRREAERTAEDEAGRRAGDAYQKAVEASDLSLEAVALAMLEYKTINIKRRDRAVKALQWNMEHLVVPHFGADRDVRTVQRVHLEEFKAALIKRYGYTTSVNNALTAIRQVLKHAKHVMEKLDEVPTIENLAFENTSRTYTVAEPDAVIRFLAAFLPDEGEEREFNLFLLNTALRKAEALSLRWEWVNWTARQISVPAEFRKGGKPQRAPTPINDLVHALLLERQARDRQPTKGRIWFQLKSYDDARRRAAVKAGIPKYRHHDARHTVATLMARDGASELDLMNQMGWSTPAMAARYAHPTAERVQAWADKLQLGVTGGVTGAVTGEQGRRGEHRRTSARRERVTNRRR